MDAPTPTTPRNETPGVDTPGVDTLKMLMDAVCGAVKHAQLDIQRTADRKIEYYFPVDPATNKTVARTVQVPIPDAQGNYALKDIPLFAIVPHHDLMIDQVSVRMKVSLLNMLDTKSGAPEIEAQVPAAGADPEMMAEIEIRLKGTDAVEGIARINDAIVKRI